MPPAIRASGLCRSAKSINVAVLLQSKCKRESERETKCPQTVPSLAYNRRHDNEYDTTNETHHSNNLNNQSFGEESSGEYELLEDNGHCEFDVEPERFHRFRLDLIMNFKNW